MLLGQSISLVTFQVHPSAGFNLKAGAFDVRDWRPANGAGLKMTNLFFAILAL